MASLTDSSLQIIKQIMSYAESRIPPQHRGSFFHFIELYFSQMPLSDLIIRSVKDLFGAAYSHWELMQEREPKQLKINIFNPRFEEYGWQSPHTVIQIITDDMPFLVDTMRMEINRMKYTIHLMVYCGGIKVRRNAQHRLLNVHSYYAKDADTYLAEAPIQMEIDRVTNPEALNEIKKNIIRVLNDVRLAVDDWRLMCNRLQECINELDETKHPNHIADVNESKTFLEWLLNNHFTFLGYRRYEVIGHDKDRALRLLPESCLGVLRDDTNSKTMRYFANLPPKAREIALSKDQVLIISKTNTISTVHRPAYTDYIGVKHFDENRQLIGESRFIGLYTSEAYRMDPRNIPFIRHKVASIIKASKLPLHSHAGKDLIHIISCLPRDDLFHAATEELFEMVTGILQMQERRCTRLFMWTDPYGRFISCLIYLPRENLSLVQVIKLERFFKRLFDPVDIAQNATVSESILARLHFVIRVNPLKKYSYDVQDLEKQIIKMTQSWKDQLHNEILDFYGEERGNELFSKYRRAFPVSYSEVFEARAAVLDIENIQTLNVNANKLGMTFYRPLGAEKSVIRFKLYRPNQTVPLSDVVPMLENLGLRVIGEQPYQITLSDGREFWINDLGLIYDNDQSFDLERVKKTFQEAFQAVWRRDAENDSFNRLVLVTEMSWREISILRAYTKYFRQMGVAFSDHHSANILVMHYRIAKLLVEYFKARFDFQSNNHRENMIKIAGEIEAELETVTSLNEDRTLRRYFTLIKATCRTNYFQLDENGQEKNYLCFKLNSKKIPDLPLPTPKYEIFVYSPRFEGIHLRAAKVARGGIRWSDRYEDFRTEVLGLMKAQQVKNALIVPAGAKGGFVTKCLPIGGKREEILQEGIICYEDFIRGLLDVTDNIVDGKVVIHERTVCYDRQDPYIVVAADKGTATFSDIANRIAEERGYWLGDAFASGGSTGYDHKKMAITARGAWVSAGRHFQDMGINLDNTEITVVGIGDMSGDVFGNGMLISQHIKLVAAFNHTHIFLDPNPNPLISYMERKRLFDLPRSTWEDYDKSLISDGGGIYSRFVKAIHLSPVVRQLLDIEQERIEPNDLIKAILKASVDLLWNGGIGTYIKSSMQTNESVGDRSNDVVRIDGKELRARVVCEGGNLGATQLGRIEYELHGGRINTDFIDNSAGVDCSDHEVNIKILLNSSVANGDLTTKARNELLSIMANEVAELVLQDNYQQNRILSFSFHYANSSLNLLMRYIQEQEKQKKINRKLEFIPDDKAILERKANGKGLTRPELCVLLAYSKIILKAELLATDITQNPYLSEMIKHAFPSVLHKNYLKGMQSHYLAREIIVTQLSNTLVSEMGITFIYQMQDEMGASTQMIVLAYAAARIIFDLESYYADIESLDYLVDTTIQYQMINEAVILVRRAVRWFLRNRRDNFNIVTSINEFSDKVKSINERLPKLVLGSTKERFDADIQSYVDHGVPLEFATRVAATSRVYHALNIIEAAMKNDAELFRVAKIYFMLVDRMELLWFFDQINSFPITNHWSILAKSRYKGDLDWVQRALTIGVLRHSSSRSIPGKVNDWFLKHQEAIDRWKSIITDVRTSEDIQFAILFVALRELIDLAEMSIQTDDANNGVTADE